MSERIENLISKEALAQFDTLNQKVEQNVSSFEKLVAKAVDLNKQLGSATGFKDMNKAATDLAKTEEDLAKAQAALLAVQERLKKAYDDEAKKLSELEKRKAKLNESYSDEAKEIAALKVQQQARNKELATEAQLQNAANGSLEKATAMVKKLTAERNKLDITTDEGIKRQAELNAELDQYNKFITDNADKQEKQRRNVGNYGSALKTLEGYLADVRAQLTATQKASGAFSISAAPGPSIRAANNTPIRTADNKQQLVAYNQTLAQSSDRVQDLQKQEQLLSRIVESQMAGFASATAEIKNNEKALQTLGAAGLQNTEFYQALLKDTAALKDNVGDLKDEIKALASGTRQFDLFAGAVTGLVNAFQVGASAAELFAGENQDVQKSIQRLVALQNISQGVQQIANDLTTKGTALNKLYNFIIGEGAATKTVNTTATTANTVATIANAEAQEAAATAATGLTVATKVLRGALIASGIGLLIAGIIYLVTKLQEWRDADINLIKHQAELNQVTLETIRINKELADLTRTDVGTYVQALKNRVAANQAYGKSQGEILANELELTKARQEAAAIDFFDTGGFGKEGELKNNLEAAATAYKEFIDQQAKIDPSDREKDRSAAQKELLESNLELAKENYTTQKKITDDYVNYNIEAANKQLQIDRLNADERRKAILQSATLSANAIIEANQRVLGNESATLNQRIALLKGIEEQQKRIARAQDQNVQNDPGVSGKEKVLSAQNLEYQIRKIQKDSLEAQRKVREEFEKREAAALREAFKIHLEDQIKANDAIANNEKKSFNDRTDALYASYEKRRQLITANYEYELQQVIKNGNITAERVALEEKALSEINNLTIEYGLQQQQIYQQNEEKINETIAKGQQARLDNLSTQQSNELLALNERFRAGKVSAEEYERERAKISDRYRLQTLQKEVDNATAVYLATKEGTNARAAAEKDLKDKTLAYSDELTKKQIEAQQKLTDVKKQAAAEYFETFSAFANAQFDAESARIQAQMDQVDKQREHDIADANATITNKEERAAAIARIEVKAQAERERLERRQRQIDLERARFEKAANIAQIIATTASAIIQALNTYKATPQAFAIAAAIGTIGALQLARAIAAPLPKFAEGTDDAPGGLAWVGDAYRKELVITPQGRVMETPAVPTVMNVPKHSIVLPDARAVLEGGLAINQQGRLVQAEYNEIKEVGRKIDTLTKVMRNKPVLNMNATDAGLTAIWNFGANTVAYIEDQTKF